MGVLQSSEITGGKVLTELRPGIEDTFSACCGQVDPKLVAWRTPEKVRGGFGSANLSFPTLFKKKKG